LRWEELRSGIAACKPLLAAHETAKRTPDGPENQSEQDIEKEPAHTKSSLFAGLNFAGGCNVAQSCDRRQKRGGELVPSGELSFSDRGVAFATTGDAALGSPARLRSG
jgi:hypothetical protein